MTETTQEERDDIRQWFDSECEDDDELPEYVVQNIMRALNDAELLAAIERQVIVRTADMPEWAVAWNKAASGRYCWFVGLHIAQEADNPTPQPAPDLRPDEPGPLWLPIIDALDAGGEDG